MKKNELIHLHGLVSNVARHIESTAVDDVDVASEAYEDLGVRPSSIHKSKTDHKAAVRTLAHDVADFADRHEVRTVDVEESYRVRESVETDQLVQVVGALCNAHGRHLEAGIGLLLRVWDDCTQEDRRTIAKTVCNLARVHPDRIHVPFQQSSYALSVSEAAELREFFSAVQAGEKSPEDPEDLSEAISHIHGVVGD